MPTFQIYVLIIQIVQQPRRKITNAPPRRQFASFQLYCSLEPGINWFVIYVVITRAWKINLHFEDAQFRPAAEWIFPRRG